jgi:hypothetical protein
MYEDMLFSLSYEQMTQMAEEEINAREGRAPNDVWEVNKAHDILRSGISWRCVDHWPGRVDRDYKRLKTLISQRNEGQ